MSAIDRLILETERRGLDFGIWSDREKVTPEFRYEVRIFGKEADEGVRHLKLGSTPWEAAAEAVDALVDGERT